MPSYLGESYQVEGNPSTAVLIRDLSIVDDKQETMGLPGRSAALSICKALLERNLEEKNRRAIRAYLQREPHGVFGPGPVTFPCLIRVLLWEKVSGKNLKAFDALRTKREAILDLNSTALELDLPHIQSIEREIAEYRIGD
jgi:hypothetical protein